MRKKVLVIFCGRADIGEVKGFKKKEVAAMFLGFRQEQEEILETAKSVYGFKPKKRRVRR